MNSKVGKCLCLYVFLLSACTTSSLDSELIEVGSPGEFLPRLEMLREQLTLKPNDAELKLAYRRLNTRALRYYSEMGKDAFDRQQYEKAMELYKNGLRIDPNNAILNQRLEKARLYGLVHSDFTAAHEYFHDGRYMQAEAKVNDVLRQFPAHEGAQALKLEVSKYHEVRVDKGPKIDLVFEKIDLPSALKFMAESYGFNVVLDSSVKDTPVTLNVKQLPFYEALSLLLSTTKNAYKVIQPSTLLVYADSKNLHEQYAVPSVKTYYLNTIDAKEMSGILRGVLDIKKVTINSVNNSITLRESDEILDAVERIILKNDVLKGEVAFDVEILEVNLSDSLLTGVDYGAYQIGTQTGAVPVTGSIQDNIKDATTLAIPSVTLNAFKQDVDAKILSNPKVRVMDGEKAKIHIGERVPLRSSDILDATGQTRTTFEYQEIGIKLSVEPAIHNNDSVTVKLQLEVSSLGENLGTAEQQAFKIGTRNAETVMMIRDGETAILGGLIKDEDRSSSTAIPGISEISGLGALFKNKDRSGTSSNILLTITPRIVRGSSQPGDGVDFQFGSSSVAGLSRLRIHPKESPKEYEAGKPTGVVVKQSEPATKDSVNIEALGGANDLDSSIAGAALGFTKSSYFGENNTSVTAVLAAQLPENARELSYELVFNQAIIDLESVTNPQPSVSTLNYESTAEENVIKVSTALLKSEKSGLTSIADISFKGKRKGTSYLVLRNVVLTSDTGETLPIDVENARIKIR